MVKKTKTTKTTKTTEVKASVPKKHTAVQKSYTERQQAAGKVRVAVWLPTERRDAFATALERLRKKWLKEDAA